MIKIRLPRKIIEGSLDDLQKYLRAKRKRPLNKRQKGKINKLIEIQKKDNELFAEQLLNSNLCRLAITQLMNMGLSIEDIKKDPALVIETMGLIVTTANEKEERPLLISYCKNIKK